MSRFGSHAWQDLLESNGLCDTDSVFARGNTHNCRHTGRSVTPLTLTSPDGSETQAYLKLNWGRRRIWPRMTDLKTGQMFQSLPEREWNGIDRFAKIGLNVPERLGLFQSGLFQFRDAVIVRAVPPLHSVDQMLQNGSWWELDDERRSSLLSAMITVMRTIHAAGIGWRGSSSRHFYPQWQPTDGWKLWLIDCEGVHRKWSNRIVERDCRKLWRAMRESGADSDTLTELQSLIDRTNGSDESPDRRDVPRAA